MRIVETSKVFNAHRETIANQIKIKEENGRCESKKGYQKGRSDKIKDKDKLGSLLMTTRIKAVKSLPIYGVR